MCGDGLDNAWINSENGLETVWKWSGGELETVWSQAGDGLEELNGLVEVPVWSSQKPQMFVWNEIRTV